MKYISKLIVVIIVLAFSGCNDDDSLLGSFRARVESDKLVLTNLSDRDVFYFAVDQGTLALINWAPGVGENQPKVKSGETIKIPLTDVTGYSGSTQVVVVNYWNAIISDGQSKAGEIQSIKLDL